MMIPLVLWHRMPSGRKLGEERLNADCATLLRRRCRSPDALGYTLLELMIVLAIISVLAAISMPALMRPWSRSHVQQAAQDLSRALLKARLDAIQYGTAYQFRSRENTGEYEIVAWQDASQPVATVNGQPLGDESVTAQRSAPPMTRREPQAMSDRREGRDLAADRRRSLSATEATGPEYLRGRLVNGVVFVPDEPPQHASVAAGSPNRQPVQDLGSDRSGPDDKQLGRPETGLPPRPTDSHHAWNEPIWFFPDGRASTAELLLRDEDGYTVRISLRGMTGTIRVSAVKQVELPAAANNPLPQVTVKSHPKPTVEPAR